jgi:hypothetical protein
MDKAMKKASRKTTIPAPAAAPSASGDHGVIVLPSSHIHGHTPTAHLDDAEYVVLMVDFGDQIAAAIRANGSPRDADELAEEALIATFQSTPDQTALDWLKAAHARAGVPYPDCTGI